jgi:hypothetical protein
MMKEKKKKAVAKALGGLLGSISNRNAIRWMPSAIEEF